MKDNDSFDVQKIATPQMANGAVEAESTETVPSDSPGAAPIELADAAIESELFDEDAVDVVAAETSPAEVTPEEQLPPEVEQVVEPKKSVKPEPSVPSPPPEKDSSCRGGPKT